MKRLVVVYNKKSSRFQRVEREVLSQLPPNHVEFLVDTAMDVNGNAAALAKFIQSGDRIISVGGDGTATIVVNAILAVDHADVTFGVAPYGNFNDMARTFGFMSVAELCRPDVKITPARALELLVNGKHFRYGMCYFTFGMFAESTRIVNRPDIRRKVRGKHFTRPRAFMEIVGWYFRYRTKPFLPKSFKLNGKIIKSATDYVAVNSVTMASVMRNRQRSYVKETFLSETGNLGRFRGLFRIMIPSVLWQIPGKPTTRDLLEFSTPSDFEIQAEGEYCTLEQVCSLEVRKANRTINVVTKCK